MEGLRYITAGLTAFTKGLKSWYNSNRHHSGHATEGEAISKPSTKASENELTIQCDGVQKHRALHISARVTPDTNEVVTSGNSVQYDSFRRCSPFTNSRPASLSPTSKATTPTSGNTRPSTTSGLSATGRSSVDKPPKPILCRGSTDEKKQVRISLDEDTGRPTEDVFVLKQFSTIRLPAIFRSSMKPSRASSSSYSAATAPVGKVPISVKPGDELTFSVSSDQPMHSPPRGRQERRTFDPHDNAGMDGSNDIPQTTHGSTAKPAITPISVEDRLASILQSGEDSLGYGGFGTGLEAYLDALTISRKGDAYQRERREEKEALRKAEDEERARVAAEELAAELAAKATRRMPSRPFIRPLSSKMDSILEDSLAKGPKATLTTTLEGTPLHQHDLMSVLGQRSWLNDEVINGYLEHIIDYANKNHSALNNTAPVAVTFNSFFYAKLHKEGYKGVARWSKRKKINGTRLLDTEIVLIPVNSNSHWTLLVVQPKKRTVEYLDSFAGNPERYIKDCFNWLKGELGKDFNEDEWQILETTSAVQKNGYDCGVFLLTNAECVTMGIDTAASYSGADMAAQRRRIAAVLLRKGFGDMGEWT